MVRLLRQAHRLFKRLAQPLGEFICVHILPRSWHSHSESARSCSKKFYPVTSRSMMMRMPLIFTLFSSIR
jgi:hypothetical protein